MFMSRMQAAPSRVFNMFASASVLVVTLVVLCMLCGCQGTTKDTSTADVDFEQAVSEDEMLQEATDPQTTLADDVAAEQATEVVDFSALEETVATIVGRYDAAGANTAITFQAVKGKTGGFAMRGDKALAAASTIKLAILATLFDEIEKGTISLDDTLTATSADVVGGTGTGISAGQSFTVEQLASKMISRSDNTASNMLISLLGMDTVNAYAANNGLDQTYLARKFMAPVVTRDNEVSSDDLATILAMIAEDRLGSPELSQLAREFLSDQYDREALAQGLTGGMQLGNKTGTLGYARNDAGILYDPNGNPVAVVAVLTNNMGEGAANKMMAEIATAICTELSS